MTETQREEITPDQLMRPFQSRGMKSIIVFTVAVHAVVLIGTSIPFLWKSVAGGGQSKLTEEQRVEVAVREATESLRGIAEKHGLKPQDLGERFAGAPAKAEPVEASEEPKVEAPAEDPKSAVEKEINTKEAGPEVPSFGDGKDDLFK